MAETKIKAAAQYPDPPLFPAARLPIPRGSLPVYVFLHVNALPNFFAQSLQFQDASPSPGHDLATNERCQLL
jgi:hypothetical protein